MFIQQPLISVLIPIYNPNLRFLEAAIESVRQQLYPRWELCLADDDSSGDRVKKGSLRTSAKRSRAVDMFFGRRTAGSLLAQTRLSPWPQANGADSWTRTTS